MWALTPERICWRPRPREVWPAANLWLRILPSLPEGCFPGADANADVASRRLRLLESLVNDAVPTEPPHFPVRGLRRHCRRAVHAKVFEHRVRQPGGLGAVLVTIWLALFTSSDGTRRGKTYRLGFLSQRCRIRLHRTRLRFDQS